MLEPGSLMLELTGLSGPMRFIVYLDCQRALSSPTNVFWSVFILMTENMLIKNGRQL